MVGGRTLLWNITGNMRMLLIVLNGKVKEWGQVLTISSGRHILLL